MTTATLGIEEKAENKSFTIDPKAYILSAQIAALGKIEREPLVDPRAFVLSESIARVERQDRERVGRSHR